MPVYGVALVEGLGKTGGTELMHIGFIWVNVGVSLGRMVMFMVAGFAQNWAAGVKVWVKVPGDAEEIVGGFHGPEIAVGTLLDVPGRAGTAPL